MLFVQSFFNRIGVKTAVARDPSRSCFYSGMLTSTKCFTNFHNFWENLSMKSKWRSEVELNYKSCREFKKLRNSLVEFQTSQFTLQQTRPANTYAKTIKFWWKIIARENIKSNATFAPSFIVHVSPVIETRSKVNVICCLITGEGGSRVSKLFFNFFVALYPHIIVRIVLTSPLCSDAYLMANEN